MESSVVYHNMQSMNQSLTALMLNRTITRETALSSSTNPVELDLQMRKIFGSIDGDAREEDPLMAEVTNDFSKIVELQEIRKLYEELQTRYKEDVISRDEELNALRGETARLRDRTDEKEQISELEMKNERLARQINTCREEYEAKIERLNLRLRELSQQQAATTEPGKRSFFRR
jgi:chromosome segregation ATPase